MGMYEQLVIDGNDIRSMTDEEIRAATGIDCSNDVPLTKQEFVEESDINVIMARCLRNGGQLPYASSVAPVFADVSQIEDYETTVRRIREAEEAFMELPANVRSFFSNDPKNAVAFVKDPANLEKAIELGLAVRREGVAAPAGPLTTPPPPAVEQIKA